ncbi:MAG: DUF4065 domain-containing protein [Spirochaetales bacterium]|nr:DUF4065 domain-containing protein [Spirochaetales bacterium]
MKNMCPYCEEIREIDIISKVEETKVRNIKVMAEVVYSACLHCKQEFASPEQMEKSLENAYSEYRKQENILSPAEIIKVRSKYGASQKAFAKIIDLGELTINSFEQGSLPTKSVSNLIQLMTNSQNFFQLFKKNKNKLTRNQQEKIKSHLQNEGAFSSYYSLKTDLDNKIYVKENYSGYNHPDWEKLLFIFQLILYFSKKELYKMAMLKIAFYIDFAYFKYHTVSLSGWPYARLPFGPVPDKYKELLFEGEAENFFKSEPDNYDWGDLYSLTEQFDYQKTTSHFNKSEIDFIKDIVFRLKDKTATQLKELTHKEKAWLKTETFHQIDYKWATELLLF